MNGRPDYVERIEAVLARRARKHAGLAVGVRAGDETHTFGRGSIADERPTPPDADTLFEIGSITKVFTATLLADLAREGRVSLDDPVQRYLPAGVELAVRGRPITLTDLATHTSGLPRLPKGMLRLALKEGKNPYANFTVAHLHAAVSAARPRRAPGARFKYSNFGAGLLGHVLALAAGKSYEGLVTERICRPLGMTDTVIAIPDGKASRLAEGHSRRGRPVPHWDLPALAGAGALRSTVNDMLAFLGAQLGNAPPALYEAIRLTHEPRARRRKLSIGLGWLMIPVRGQQFPVFFHDGGTGGFRSVAGFVRETGTAVVVLSSSSRPVTNLGVEILEAIGDVAPSARAIASPG